MLFVIIEIGVYEITHRWWMLLSSLMHAVAMQPYLRFLRFDDQFEYYSDKNVHIHLLFNFNSWLAHATFKVYMHFIDVLI